MYGCGKIKFFVIFKEEMTANNSAVKLQWGIAHFSGMFKYISYYEKGYIVYQNFKVWMSESQKNLE